MFLVLKLFYEGVRRFDLENKDVRTENFFLMGSPLPILAISIAYWYFVKKLGPSLMSNRRAFELKYVLLVYNLFQVFINLMIVFMVSSTFIEQNTISKWSCIETDRNTTPYSIKMIQIFHLYYMVKVLDYMDTIFFVLRKSYKQITFLHVYHHILMAVGSYAGVRYLGGGQSVLLGYLNAYVHGVMYFYYFVSALRPAMKNSLWWKKYITQMQILQFVLNVVHFTAALLSRDCRQPKMFLFFCVLQNIYMTLMFLDFYIKAYIKKSKMREIVENKEK